MKWARKHDRNIAIVREFTSEPYPTLHELGKKYGVTREAIRLVLKKAGVDTGAYRKLRHQKTPPPVWVCKNCGKEFTKQNSPHLKRSYCCRQCQEEYRDLDPNRPLKGIPRSLWTEEDRKIHQRYVYYRNKERGVGVWKKEYITKYKKIQKEGFKAYRHYRLLGQASPAQTDWSIQDPAERERKRRRENGKIFRLSRKKYINEFGHPPAID